MKTNAESVRKRITGAVLGAFVAAGAAAVSRPPARAAQQGSASAPAATKGAGVPDDDAPLAGVALPVGVPELVIDGHVVMRLRTQAGGLTPTERAYDLRKRLGPILTLPGLSANDVEVRQERPGQTASIFVRRRLLVTVDRNLAKANDTSVDALAEHWARNLRQALPRVNVAVRMSDGDLYGSTGGVR
jgi:hypothetical protein